MRQQKIAMIAVEHVKKTRLSSEMEFRHGEGGKKRLHYEMKKKKIILQLLKISEWKHNIKTRGRAVLGRSELRGADHLLGYWRRELERERGRLREG